MLVCYYFQHLFILQQNTPNDLAKEVAVFINIAITLIILNFNLQYIFMLLQRLKQKKFQATLNETTIICLTLLSARKSNLGSLQADFYIYHQRLSKFQPTFFR